MGTSTQHQKKKTKLFFTEITQAAEMNIMLIHLRLKSEESKASTGD